MVELFWEQYPLGGKLSWSLVSKQFHESHVYFIEGTSTLLMKLIMVLKTISVFAIPIIKSLKDLIEELNPYQTKSAPKAIFILFGLLCLVFTVAILLIVYIIAIALLILIFALGFAGFLILWPGTFLAFFCWLCLYRLPLYEFAHPRLMNWMLQRNSRVYQPLESGAGDSTVILRVVQIKQGKGKEEIECELVTGKLNEFSFEALSYVWGITMIPWKIKVNGQPFFVTYNLHSALHGLRRHDSQRLVWIDAMCINQFDLAEKSAQVQLMHTIYSKSSQAIVWLGESSASTSKAFDFVEEISGLSEEEKESLWQQKSASDQWKQVQSEFMKILSHDWWTRAWIIQEVVAARRVFMQRGNHTVRWEDLFHLINYPLFYNSFGPKFPYEVISFGKKVQELRVEATSDQASSGSTLLSLAYHFRHQAATFGSDKIYALLGLLRDGNPTRIIPDYRKQPEEIFLHFTISCLEYNKNLIAVALASGAELHGISWCRDWRFQGEGLFAVRWFSTHKSPHKTYSAAGDYPVEYKYDATRPGVLSVRGFQVDFISKLGDFSQSEGQRSNTSWSYLLQSWEYTAGGPWMDGAEKQKSFFRTITADWWAEEPMDWKDRVKGILPGAPTEDDTAYTDVLEDVCVNRRFFITKTGRFGLGPWNMKKNDIVCILLGSNVPFILRKCAKGSKNRQHDYSTWRTNEHVGSEEYFKVIGEAYCDEVMYYNGNIKHDTERGHISLRDYQLV
jgi:hypothetical protein